MIKPILNKLFWGGFRHLLTDKQYGRFRYWLELDRWPDFKNPQSFSEKIQYIKLHQRTELRQRVADRNRVRTYVVEKIGEEHLIPLIGNYDEFTNKVWESLPNQFVLKANHGCGMVEIVQDKSSRNGDKIQKLTRQWQQFDYYNFGREWVYKNI
ncbi:MAG: ATP-grasp fold amidoligase family protein, partial [Balneolaceae bacterium]